MMSPNTKASCPAIRISQGSQPDGRWARMPRKARKTMARPHASYTADCSTEPCGSAKKAAMNSAPITAVAIQARWRRSMWRQSSTRDGFVRTPRSYSRAWVERGPGRMRARDAARARARLLEVRRNQPDGHERDRGDAARGAVVGQRELEVAASAVEPVRGLDLAVAVDRGAKLHGAESRLRGAELPAQRGDVDVRPDREVAGPLDTARPG